MLFRSRGLIDISSSMLAEDFKPNRLEAVKEAALNFIANRPEDRIGLLVFAGETFIQCPLTTDKQVLSSLLKDIRIAEKEYDGTAIGMAIANATNRLRDSKAKSKVMILLSDGKKISVVTLRRAYASYIKELLFTKLVYS